MILARAKRLGIRHALIILVDYNYAIVELTEAQSKQPSWTVVAEAQQDAQAAQEQPTHILH